MRGPRIAQDGLYCEIYVGITTPAALVGQVPAIADTRERQAVCDPIEPVAVLVQPCERPDRPRGEEEAVRVPKPSLHQLLREHRRNDDPREVVVGERGVAYIGRDQDLAVPSTLDQVLGVGEVAWLRGSSR